MRNLSSHVKNEFILLDWFKGAYKGKIQYSTDVLYRLSQKVYIEGKNPSQGKTIPVTQEQYNWIQSAVISDQESIKKGWEFLKNNNAAEFRHWAINNRSSFETMRSTVSNAIAKGISIRGYIKER